MTYRELKKKQQDEINAFPLMFAFNKGQFADGMRKLGLDPDDTAQIQSIGGGGYVRKTDYVALENLLNSHAAELREAIAADPTGDGFIYDMFYTELADHEYIISGDLAPALAALNLSVDDVNGSETLLHGLRKATEAQSKFDY